MLLFITILLVLYQKRYRRERKVRLRYQQQLDSVKGGKSMSDGSGGTGVPCSASGGTLVTGLSCASLSSGSNNGVLSGVLTATSSSNLVNDEARSTGSNESLQSKQGSSITDLTRKSDPGKFLSSSPLNYE